MADEDEIDVLGDFSLSNFSSENGTNMLDNTPLVSQNSDLLNCDYTIHPQWLLDKPSANPDNWYESNSVASTSDLSETDTLGHVSTENCITDESGWTEKEKNLLHRGIEIFGKSSVRLSQFVGSKSSSEVKYYLKNFFSENQSSYQHDTDTAIEDGEMSKSTAVSDVLDGNQIPASIEEVIAAVSTGCPTVKSNRRARTKSSCSTSNTLIRSKDISPNQSLIKSRLGKKRLADNVKAVKTQVKFKNFKIKSIQKEKSHSKTVKFKFMTQLKVPIKQSHLKKLVQQKVVKVVNNETRQIQVGKAEITTGKGLSVPLCEGEEIIKIKKVEDDSSDESIDIEDLDDAVHKSSSQVDLKNLDCPVKEKSNLPCQKISVPNQLNDKKTATDEKLFNQSISKSFDISLLDDKVVQQLMRLDEPTSEVILDENNVTELEKVIHSDFFEGRPLKTPERYLKIRNHIISSWKSLKPNYITKTSMRMGLKSCGDVNCISRIHFFLEQLGAINFGCEQTKYDLPLYNMVQFISHQKNKLIKKTKTQTSREIGELGPRQRIKKRFNNDGEGGCTLVHGDEGQVINTTIVNEEPVKQKMYCKKPSIRLIYCRPFTEEKPQEYAVKINLSTLLLMDFHAHTYLTEVMGLVGGNWNFQRKILTITCYEPCKNIASSVTHCDMCPISQAKAAENIHCKGLNILGWFHSHPTFAPEPSQQDLDTQKFVQQWIGYSKPCIGVILSPFSFNGALISSPFRCLMVDKKPNFEDQLVPYRFKVDVTAEEFCVLQFLKDMKRILFFEGSYLKHKRVCFNKPYFQDLSISHLDKFISSVNMHLAKNGDLSKTASDGIIAGIKDLLLTKIQSEL